MPQIFQVLRCYKCLTFQVHHTKKSNKFACKICDEKQSVKRHYGIGIAKDCRMHVQKLNKMRGEKDETKLDISDEYEEENTSNSIDDTSDTADNEKKTSKWLSYIDKVEKTDIDEGQILSETNYYENKKWWTKNKYQNYKGKKYFVSKRKSCYVDDENDLNDVDENIHDNDNTKNVLCKRPLFENREECRAVNKVSKPTPHYNTQLQINNSEFKNNLKDFTSINKTLKLETSEVNKSSKWAQFIEKEEHIEENGDNEAVEHVTKNIQPFFTLCDESDIDDVLDF